VNYFLLFLRARALDSEVGHAFDRNAFFFIPTERPTVIVVHHNLPDQKPKESSCGILIQAAGVINGLVDASGPIGAWNPARRVYFTRVKPLVKFMMDRCISLRVKFVQGVAPAAVVSRVWHRIYSLHVGHGIKHVGMVEPIVL
jgi:hypothetical protein